MAELENRIIHLGTVRWFGGYNSKGNGSHNNFGYLNKRILFRAWGFDSHRKEYYIRHRLQNCLAFFCFENDDENLEKADWVKLVDEMTEEDLVFLYHRNDSFRIIMDNPDNYFPLLKFPALRALLTDVVRSLGVRELMRLYLQRPDMSADLIRTIVSGVSWGKVDVEEAIEFYLLLPRHHSVRTKILRDSFPKWIDHERVVVSLKPEDFPGCIPENTGDQAISLLRDLRKKVPDPDLKWKIGDYLLQNRFQTAD